MMDCEHKFGFKRRENGEHYCPVCRAYVLPEDVRTEDESIGQGGDNSPEQDGRRFSRSSSGQSLQWRKL